MTTRERNCTTCWHYRPADTGTAEAADYGECRAHPPDVVVINDEPLSLFPQVDGEEDCGEWKASQ